MEGKEGEKVTEAGGGGGGEEREAWRVEMVYLLFLCPEYMPCLPHLSHGAASHRSE